MSLEALSYSTSRLGSREQDAIEVLNERARITAALIGDSIFAPQTTSSGGGGGRSAFVAEGFPGQEISARPHRAFPTSLFFDCVVLISTDPVTIRGRDLIESACIRALVIECKSTTTPKPVRFSTVPSWLEQQVVVGRLPTHTTIAQTLLADIRTFSGLTLEEIAPLVGVSRRSLQNWLAGESISARKEQRLRNLADFLRALPGTDVKDTLRETVFTRSADGVRPYDLVAEGRFGDAFAALTGSTPPAHLSDLTIQPALPPITPLPARLSLRHSSPPGTVGRLNVGRSGPLKR
jgi:transcriptional regulator with XRE-family HTH domain